MDNNEHKSYIIQAGFWRFDAGTMRVYAKTEEEARELLPKMLQSARDIQIFSVIPESEIKDIVEQSNDAMPTPSSDGSSTPPVFN